jgi:hypothetical protein
VRVDGATPWVPWAQLISMVRGKTRKLACCISGDGEGGWFAAAVEVALEAKTATQAFADHGHKQIGTFAHLDDATYECEKFAERWLLSGENVEACGCPEIELAGNMLDMLGEVCTPKEPA